MALAAMVAVRAMRPAADRNRSGSGSASAAVCRWGTMATNTAATGRTKRANKKWSSRAVLRTIEPGSSVDCQECGERVKFQARQRLMQMICNVYEDGVWQRVEHFHAECYEKAGRPYGDPVG